MKSYKSVSILILVALFFPLVSHGATLFSQTITLNPGWNIVSAPRVLDSHTFSAAETSDNFDIYALNPTSSSGWATMADLGQTDFTPLYGYFVDNKTGVDQTLTFNYKSGVTPADQLFDRSFPTTGWYSIGIANPSYALPTGGANTTPDTDNPDHILNSLLGTFSYYSDVIDFTNAAFNSTPDSVAVTDPWKLVTRSTDVSNTTEVNSLNDFRETKGYAVYIKQPNALYNGYQNSSYPAPSSSIIANGQSNSLSMYAGTTTLAWSSSGTSNCTVTPGNFTGTSGSQSVYVSTSTVYTLACTGLDGTSTTSSSVNINISIPTVVTVGVDPSFTTTTVVGGATNVPIAQYKFTGSSEDTKITSLTLTPSISGGSPSGSTLNNVSLYAQGAQIGSTQNFTGSPLTFNLGSSLIIPAGQSIIVTVKSDLVSSSSVNYSSGLLTVDLSGSTQNAQGMSSHTLSQIPSSTITSNALTIGSNTIIVTKNVALTNQSVNPNSPSTKIGSFVIQDGSSEGFQVTNLQVGVVSSAGLTNLTNLHAVAGSNTITPSSLNPQSSNNFSSNFTIPLNSTQVVDVYADIGSQTGTASTTLTVTGRGIVSNVSTTTSTTAGQVVTIVQGGVTSIPVIVSSATLPGQYIIGPSSPTIATYNVISTSSSATLDELRFTITGSSTVASVAITASGQTHSAQVVNGIADLTGLGIAVPQGFGGVNLTLTPTYATVSGTNTPLANQLALINLTGVKSRSGNSTTFIGTTQSGGSGTIAVTGEQTMTLVTTKPTLAINTGTVSGLSNGLVEVGDVTISADVAGNILVNQLPVTLNTSGNVTLSNQDTGDGSIVIKDQGNNIITSATTTLSAVGTNSTGNINIVFTGGYQIAAGTSQTFKIFATTSNVSGNAGTNAVSTKIGSSSVFNWTDVNGNASGLSGTLISNFPTSTHTITN